MPFKMNRTSSTRRQASVSLDGKMLSAPLFWCFPRFAIGLDRDMEEFAVPEDELRKLPGGDAAATD
jgi:hypothetical protein